MKRPSTRLVTDGQRSQSAQPWSVHRLLANELRQLMTIAPDRQIVVNDECHVIRLDRERHSTAIDETVNQRGASTATRAGRRQSDDVIGSRCNSPSGD